MKQYSTKNPFTLLCCKKVIQLYKNSKGTVQNKIIRLKSALRHVFIHVFLMNSVHQPLLLLFLGKEKSLFSHVSAQSGVELCETLNKLLELGPLLWVQGPATSHHCKPATKGGGGGEAKVIGQIKCLSTSNFRITPGVLCVCETGCSGKEKEGDWQTKISSWRQTRGIVITWYTLSMCYTYRSCLYNTDRNE